jgi:hypothetical protein
MADAKASGSSRPLAAIETLDDDPTDIFEFLAQLGEGYVIACHVSRVVHCI